MSIRSLFSRVLGITVISAISALPACSPGPVDPPEGTTIGAAGGTIESDGIKLVIPPGALASDTVVVVKAGGPAIPETYDATSQVVTVGAATLTFAKPVTVTFAVTANKAGGDRSVVLWSAAGESLTAPTNWDLMDGCDDVALGFACVTVERGGTGFAVEALAVGRLGPAGGVVEGEGVSLEVPAGAVTANRTYSILRNVVAAKAGETAITDVYSLGPSHTTDLQPYTLELETFDLPTDPTQVVALFTKHLEPSTTPTVWEEHAAEVVLAKGRSKVRTQNNARSSVFIVKRGEDAPDAGETIDAGEETPDAGEETPDAGEETPDAGEAPIDAGTPVIPDPEKLEFPAFYELTGAASTGGAGLPVPLTFFANGGDVVAAAILEPGPVTQAGASVTVTGGNPGSRRVALFEGLSASSTTLPAARAIDASQGESLASVIRCGTSSFAITKSASGVRVIGQGPTGGLAAATLQKTSTSTTSPTIKVLGAACAGTAPVVAISTTGDLDVTGPAGAVGEIKGSDTALGRTAVIGPYALFAGGDLAIPTVRDVVVHEIAGRPNGDFLLVLGGSSTGLAAATSLGEGEFGLFDSAGGGTLRKITSDGAPHVVALDTTRTAEFGQFRNTLTLAPGVTLTAAPNAKESYVAIFSAGASPIGKKGGGMSIDRVAPGPSSTIVVAGTHASAASTYGLAAPTGLADAFVAVLDSSLNSQRSASFGKAGTTAELLALTGNDTVANLGVAQVGFVTREGLMNVELGFGGLFADGKRGYTQPALVKGGAITAVHFLGGEDVLLGFSAGTQLHADPATAQSPAPPVPPVLDGNGRSKVRTQNNAR